MMRLTVDYQGFEALQSYVQGVGYRLFDLRPLAERIALIMWQQNALERSIGHDQYDVPFVQLAASTMRRRVRQGRLGPPLAPDGPASDIVGGFKVEILATHPDHVEVRGHWPGAPWVIYHVDHGASRGHLPVRDPAGLAPYAQGLVADEFYAFVSAALDG